MDANDQSQDRGNGKSQTEAFGRAEHSSSPENRPTPDYRSKEQDRAQPSQSPPQEPNRIPMYKRPVLMSVLILVLLVVGIGGVLYYLHARNYESTDDAFIDGHVVPISPRVSALVIKLNIDDNTPVKTNDILVELDPTDFKTAVAQAQAVEAANRGKLDESKALVEVNDADVVEAQADEQVAETNLENAERDLKRFESLDERARSQQQLDNATFAEKSAKATVAQTTAKIKAAQAQRDDAVMAVETAKANLAEATANVQSAQTNLDYCTIRALSDGLITRKSVEVGSYVQVGQALFSIVPKDVWVTANFKETQLNQMQIGQPVTISVDAYPDRKFSGIVNSIQNGTGARFTLLPPENATGNYVKVVQRVPVKIVFRPGETNIPGHLLSPGMSVEPEVNISAPGDTSSTRPQ